MASRYPGDTSRERRSIIETDIRMNWNTIKETLKDIKKEVVYGVLGALVLVFAVRSCTARQDLKRQGWINGKHTTELVDSIDALNTSNRLYRDSVVLYRRESEHLRKMLKSKDETIASKNETIRSKDKYITSKETE